MNVDAGAKARAAAMIANKLAIKKMMSIAPASTATATATVGATAVVGTKRKSRFANAAPATATVGTARKSKWG